MIKKISYLVLSIITIIYTLWYMHFGSVFTNSGALSTIGLKHHTLFVIWGVLTFVSLAWGIITLYERYCKRRFYVPLVIASGVGMALTLCFDFDYDKMPDYYFHYAGSLAFSVVTGAAVFLLFALCYKKATVFKVLTFVTGALLIGDTVCLLIFKETSLIEAVPIIAGLVMLNIANLRRDKVEITR